MSADRTDTRDDDVGDQPPRWQIDGRWYGPADLLGEIKARDARIDTLEARLAEKDEQIDALASRLDDLEAGLEDTQDDVDAVKDRTDLLQFVANADDTTAEEGRGAILQHMQRMVRDEDGDDRTYSMTRSKTNEVLHDPDVDRTTVNRWMRTAAELVGDESICRYEGGDPGRGGREARITLDLRDEPDDALPSEIHNGGR